MYEEENKLKYKLIAIDMDGTLLNSKNEVSKRTRNAILGAEKKGVHVILATGRLLTSAVKYSAKMELRKPIISSNGALVIGENEEVIFEKSINKDTIEIITELADEVDLYYHFYSKDSFYSNRYSEDIIQFYNPKGIRQEDRIKFNLYENIREITNKDIDVYKFTFIDNDVRKLYRLKEALRDINGINISSSWSNNLEVMEKEVSKGNSLKYLCERLDVSRENVIAIGDNQNDLSMLNYAGLGVSMGNGDESVKSIADIVTSTNDEDGVAKIIEKYIL